MLQIVDQPLPDDQAPGWVHARNWIVFFRAMEDGKKVWMRVVTRVLDGEEPVEVHLCGSPEGYHARALGREERLLASYGDGEAHPDLRTALSKSEFLDRTASELGLGLK